ncbi:MAG: threonylcarbamoyl-AMP synthase [Nitrospirae bacterium]|nr:threonylcarbamoyl-AMP synthase [Nitrospirota bacterium]
MVNIIKVNEKNIKKIFEVAVKTLREGGIVSYQTETFYAIGAKFDIESALRRIYALKKRPSEKAMPLIVADVKSLFMVAKDVNRKASDLIERFWPGPLTILLPAKKGLSDFITHRGKVAVRVPGESFALLLGLMAGFPITATSANPSEMPPAKTAEMVMQYFGTSIDLIIDSGRTKARLPSTIVDTTGNKIKIIRQGGLRIK